MPHKSIEELAAERRQARGAAGPPAKRPAKPRSQPTPCSHRGPAIGDTGCRSCKGDVRLKLFECNHPENGGAECVIDRKQLEPGPLICANCHLRTEGPQTATAIEWAAGITAAKRPARETLPLCLETLAAAGWAEPIIFADGHDVELPAGSRAVIRQDKAGALCNFYAAAAELVARYPDAAHLLGQDDTTYTRGIRQYLENAGWPPDAILLKLYTADDCRGPAGWHEIPQKLEMRGAQAYVFPPGQLARFLASDETSKQRRGTYRQNQAIDNVVARWARTQRGRQYCHTPSLCQHTGQKNSILGHDMPPAKDYPGNDFDAATLAGERPTVCAVMVTQPGRRELARRAIDSFYRQSYDAKARELLILIDRAAGDSEGLLEDYEPPAGAPACTVREAIAEYQPGQRPTLGEMRNAAFEQTRAALLIQWDDDDYHGPDRIATQVAAHKPGQPVILARQIRADLHGPAAFVFSRRKGIEGTILHDRDTRHRYPHQSKAEDTEFLRQWPPAIILDNDPDLYVRFAHGANTWPRAHILDRAGDELTRSQARRLENIRRLYPQTPRQRWATHLPNVDGWAGARFCGALLELALFQEQAGLRGPILEIGIHHGRTLLGLVASGATVVAVDPFEKLGQPNKWNDSPNTAMISNGEQRRRILAGHLQAVFDTPTPANLVILERFSQDLTAEQLSDAGGGSRFRLIHIDGDHSQAAAYADIAKGAALLEAGGLMAIDDIANPRWLGVAPAFWRQSKAGFRPIAMLGSRLLVTNSDQWADRYAEQLAGLGKAKTVELDGRTVAIIPESSKL